MRPAIIDREIGFALDKVCKMGDEADQFEFWDKYALALFKSTLARSSLGNRYPTLMRKTSQIDTETEAGGSRMILSTFTESDARQNLRVTLSWAAGQPGGVFMSRWRDDELVKASGVGLEDFGWLMETVYREVTEK